MSAQPQPRLTPEQYLELERAAEFRSEYYRGRMYPRADASFRHVIITTNLGAELSNALKRRPGTVRTSALRMRVALDGLYAYPDVVVVGGEPRFTDRFRDTLMNPSLLIEVLSPSTEALLKAFRSIRWCLSPSRAWRCTGASPADIGCCRNSWGCSRLAPLKASTA